MDQEKLFEIIWDDICKSMSCSCYWNDLAKVMTICYNWYKFRSIIHNNCIWIQQVPPKTEGTDSGHRKILMVNIADPKSIGLIIDYIRSAY